MAIPQIVSGVGAGAKRVDKNNVQRVQRIQKNAQIQQASGGAYGDRLRNESFVQQAPTNVPTPAMGMPVGKASARAPMPSSDIFAPTTHNNPLSNGSKGGPGDDDSGQQTPVDNVNQDAVFARAMLAANPGSRQLFMMVESFNEMDANLA
jgi:hypothetical protein